MKETAVVVSTSCQFELIEYETFPATLTLDYIEHSPAHGYSDTETSITIDKGQARQIISILERFLNS